MIENGSFWRTFKKAVFDGQRVNLACLKRRFCTKQQTLVSEHKGFFEKKRGEGGAGITKYCALKAKMALITFDYRMPTLSKSSRISILDGQNEAKTLVGQ